MKTEGEIITFYSYKGGTGRTMALANVASLMAMQGRRVLAIDWDIEAPGLHRFLQAGHSDRSFHNLENESPGLMDMIALLAANVMEKGTTAIRGLDLTQFCYRTSTPSLYVMTAGRFDQDYSRRVAEFNWEACFNRSPTFFYELASRLADEFDYVLIDSRTGVSDVGGVCTMLMPTKLVLVFTPNRQSLYGGIEVLQRVTRYRISSDDVRPVIIYPLPSRIELSESLLRQEWRTMYQQEFEASFQQIYGLDNCDLTPYFDNVQIPHSPRYAFGEDIAVLTEGSKDRLSFASNFDQFTYWLTHGVPWEVVRPPR
jgi:MinD-like ATPase involved in chromosome partitioning or flagellar assembly